MRRSYYFGPHIRYLKKLDWANMLLTVLHWIVFALGLLLVLYYLLFCCGVFVDAVQDYRKFSGLGVPYSFWYYFDQERFVAEVCPFVLVGVQLLLYVVLYRRAKYKRPSWACVLYFSVMAAFHLFLYLHANALDLSSIPIENDADIMVRHYYVFTNVSLIHPFLYLAVYLLGMWKLQKNTVTGDGSV